MVVVKKRRWGRLLLQVPKGVGGLLCYTTAVGLLPCTRARTLVQLSCRLYSVARKSGAIVGEKGSVASFLRFILAL